MNPSFNHKIDQLVEKIDFDVMKDLHEVENRRKVENWDDMLSQYNQVHKDACIELIKAVRCYLNGCFPDQMLSEHYDRDVKNLVNVCIFFHNGQDLYKLVEQALNDHVMSNILPKMRCVDEKNFFPVLADNWERFKKALFSSKFTPLFFYLDRWANQDSYEATAPAHIGIKAYRTEFLFDIDILNLFDKSLRVLMRTPTNDSEFSDFSFLKSVCDMLTTLNYDKQLRLKNLENILNNFYM